MAKYYLFDMHAANIADARLVDVVSTSRGSGEFRVDGLTPIRVPGGVEVIDPTSLEDLLEQKRNGIRALYPGFTNIVWDDLLDPSGISVASIGSSVSANYTTIGSRLTIGGRIDTINISLGDIVSQCVIVYEAYSWRYENPAEGRFARYYVERAANDLGQVRASASGTTPITVVTEGAVTTFDGAHSGNELLLEFGVPPTLPTPRVGYWAMLY